MVELDPGNHVNDAYDVTFTDGTHGVYKPNVPENEFVQGRSSIPENQLAAREVAASRLNEDLGFDLVPTTARWDGPHGAGSMQEFVENASQGLPPGWYTIREREQMAVLDYISGNTDRHMGNYLTGPDGRLVAIDHGYSFPESNAELLRSEFVQQQKNQPLSPETMARVSTTTRPGPDGRTVAGVRPGREGGRRRDGPLKRDTQPRNDHWRGVERVPSAEPVVSWKPRIARRQT